MAQILGLNNTPHVNGHTMKVEQRRSRLDPDAIYDLAYKEAAKKESLDRLNRGDKTTVTRRRGNCSKSIERSSGRNVAVCNSPCNIGARFYCDNTVVTQNTHTLHTVCGVCRCVRLCHGGKPY